METVSMDRIKDNLRAAQHTHHVLAFLAQFYVQSLPPCAEVNDVPICIPCSLAIPFVGISRQMDIAPIVSNLKSFESRNG
jgi:hypothetical protein